MHVAMKVDMYSPMGLVGKCIFAHVQRKEETLYNPEMERRFPWKSVDRWESTLAVCCPNTSSIYPIQSIYSCIVDAWWYELEYFPKGTHMFHFGSKIPSLIYPVAFPMVIFTSASRATTAKHEPFFEHLFEF